MRYWFFTLLGMLICLACLLGMTWALYHLVRTGTCASGGPYVSARPCPEDTGTKVLVLIGSIFGIFIGLGVYAARGMKGAGGTVGLGIAMWSLLFISLAAATFVAAYGPANNDDPGARSAAIILAIVFLPMGLIPLIGMLGFGLGRDKVQQRFGPGADAPRYPKPAPSQFNVTMPTQPSPAPPAAPPPVAPGGSAAAAAGTDDPAARLKKLAELRDAGLLTDEEYDEKRQEILRGM
jgi:Short C-terminal domain